MDIKIHKLDSYSILLLIDTSLYSISYNPLTLIENNVYMGELSDLLTDQSVAITDLPIKIQNIIKYRINTHYTER